MNWFNRNLLALLLAAAYLTIGFAEAQDLIRENGYYLASIKKTYEMAKGTEIDIDADRADILIVGWDKKSIDIEEVLRIDARDESSARRDLNENPTDYFERGNSLRIVADGYHGSIRQNFIIYVPRTTRVRVEIQNGDVEIQEVSDIVRLRTSNGDVTLQQIRGDIDVHTSSGDISIDNAIGNMDIHTSGGNIRLENIEGRLDGNTSGGSIRLRQAKSTVYLNTSGGDIDLENITGNVQASTSGGNIDAQNCTGSLRVNTSGGDIDFDTVTGPVTATTSGGDIIGDRINDRIIARTSGGDIELNRVNGPVRAETDAGEIDVEIVMTDFTRDHDITLKTRVGDIRLSLPAKIPASISARIWRESRRWSDHDIDSEFPLPVRENNNGRQLSAEGDINGGGDKIDIETGHGDISIRKSR